MTALRWLGVPLAVGIAAAAFTSCKGSAGSSTTAGLDGGGGTKTATGTGGEPDGGNDGGGTGGSVVDAGPILCLATSTNIAKTGPCNLIDQDCPPGKTCQPAEDGTQVTTSCITATGLKAAGETCYTGDECDAKLMCIGLSASHSGQCVAFCCNDSSNAPCNGGLCNEKVTFGGGNFAYMCSYGQRCQLLTADACPAGFDCHVEPAAGQGVAVCLAPSPTEVGALGTCHYINDCPSMIDCYGLSSSASGTCLYYCALSGSTMNAAPGLGGCPNGETCQSTYQGQSVNTGVSGIGLCIPNGGLVGLDAGKDAATGG